MSPISKAETGSLSGVKEKKKGLHSFTLLAEFVVMVAKKGKQYLFRCNGSASINKSIFSP